MEDNSELHPGSLRIQCNKAIEVIDKENEAYEELISKLRTNIVENDTMSGETADSIKAYASDLIFVVEYAIEANELDKIDHQTILNEIDNVLADKVDVNEVLRGYEIHEEIKYLEEQISIYEEYISREILNLNINDLNEIKEVEYREQIADLERVLQYYKNKEERYDVISSNTEGLFCSSTSIRNNAKKTVSGMFDLIKCNTEGYIDYYKNNEDPVIVDLYKKRYIKRKYPDLYTYLAGLKDENGNLKYSESKVIEYIFFLENKQSAYLTNLGVLSHYQQREYDARLYKIANNMDNYQYNYLINESIASDYYSTNLMYREVNGLQLYWEKQTGDTWGMVVPSKSNVSEAGCFIYASAALVSYYLGKPYTVEQVFEDSGKEVSYKNGYFYVNDEKNWLYKDLGGSDDKVRNIFGLAGITSAKVIDISNTIVSFDYIIKGLGEGKTYIVRYYHPSKDGDPKGSGHWVTFVGLDENGDAIVLCSNSTAERIQIIGKDKGFEELQNNYEGIDFAYEISVN